MLFLPAALLATDWAVWLNWMEAHGCPQSLCILGCFVPTIAFVFLAEVTAAQFDEIVADDAVRRKLAHTLEGPSSPGRSRWLADLPLAGTHDLPLRRTMFLNSKPAVRHRSQPELANTLGNSG